MPQFDVILKRITEEYLTLSVRAKDEEAAEQKANEFLEKHEGNLAAMAKAAKGEWEFQSEEFDIEAVQEA